MPRPKNDLTGMEFGYWTVIKPGKAIKGKQIWLCRCKCGNEKYVYGYSLLSGDSKSCGCLGKPSRIIDLSGKRFGRLTAEKIVSKRPQVMWECVCDCGNVVVVSATNLKAGKANSCGCINAERMRSLSHDGTNPLSVLSPKLSKRNTTGVKGVSREGKKYIMEIMFKGKRIRERYDTLEEAANRRKELERELYSDIIITTTG